MLRLGARVHGTWPAPASVDVSWDPKDVESSNRKQKWDSCQELPLIIEILHDPIIHVVWVHQVMQDFYHQQYVQYILP